MTAQIIDFYRPDPKVLEYHQELLEAIRTHQLQSLMFVYMTKDGCSHRLKHLEENASYWELVGAVEVAKLDLVNCL